MVPKTLLSLKDGTIGLCGNLNEKCPEAHGFDTLVRWVTVFGEDEEESSSVSWEKIVTVGVH